MRLGQRFVSPAGGLQFSGVVEYLTENPFDALAASRPAGAGRSGSGIAGYPGGPKMAALNFYIYGDQAINTVGPRDAAVGIVVP